jgi:hypothetical protein
VKRTFVERVEAVASIQYLSDEAIERIDSFVVKVQAMDGISQRDKDAILETIGSMKPVIIQNLLWKALNTKSL